MTLRIKICGITRVEDARAAVRAGADAIGLVFTKSPRRVDIATARRIVRVLPRSVTPVGVFVNSPAAVIKRTARAVGLKVVQLHGDETVMQAARLAPLRVIKAVRVRDESFMEGLRPWMGDGGGFRPAAILLDAYSRSARGGTGRRFDWRLAARARQSDGWNDSVSLILAGGLDAGNVARAIRQVRPDAVDVSGGVEMRPGVKAPAKIEQFINAARSALHRSRRSRPRTRRFP